MPKGQYRRNIHNPLLGQSEGNQRPDIGELLKKAQDAIKSVENDGIEPKKRERPQRASFGSPRQKLSVRPIEGFHLHWVNDSPGRVEEAQEGGYEFVGEEEIAVAGQAKQSNSDLGTRVKRLVGRGEDGNALFAYLMKIPIDWYEQDQKVIQDRVDAVDNMIKRGSMVNVDRAYAPDAPPGSPAGAGIKISQT